MEQQDERPAATLMRLVSGFQVSQAISVVAALGIADLLADGPRNADELAVTTGSHPRSLYRLLRALAGVGVFRENAEGRFALTPLSDCLRSDATEPVAPLAALFGQPDFWQAWGDLRHSVQTGEYAFRHVHGMSPWEYRECHPEAGAVFDRAMTGSFRAEADAALAAYDFGRFGTVVGVGGGQGAFLAALLARHQGTRGFCSTRSTSSPGRSPCWRPPRWPTGAGSLALESTSSKQSPRSSRSVQRGCSLVEPARAFLHINILTATERFSRVIVKTCCSRSHMKRPVKFLLFGCLVCCVI